MPASFQIDVARRLVSCRAWGVFTAKDLIDHYAAIVADPHFDPTFSQLADLGGVERFDVSAATIRREALEPVFSESSLRAIVAPSDVAYGLSRIYAAYAEYADQNVRVFRDMREAEEWLGLVQMR